MRGKGGRKRKGNPNLETKNEIGEGDKDVKTLVEKKRVIVVGSSLTSSSERKIVERETYWVVVFRRRRNRRCRDSEEKSVRVINISIVVKKK